MILPRLLAWALTMGGLAPAHAAEPLTPDPRGAVVPDRSHDLTRLELDVIIDAEGGIAGTAAWSGTRLAPGPLVLDAVGLDIDAVTGSDGTALPWELRAGRLTIRERSAETMLLPVTVRYHGRPQTGLHVRRAGRAAYPEVWTQGEATDNRHWFPGWDHPNDRFVVRSRVTAPDGWKVLVNDEVEVVNYLVMLAAGPYVVVGEADNQVWVPPGTDPEAVARVRDPIPAMKAHFAARTGVAYPWPSYRQVFVQQFMYTGMENTTATVMDRSLVEGSSIDGTRGDRIENVVAHELAHQWYGDLLTCRDWRHLWLNEGFATFMADDWMAHAHGEASWGDSVFDASRAARGEVPVAGSFHQKNAPQNNNVYNKGFMVLQMLRTLLGEATFWAGVQRYTTAHRGQLVESIDLQRAMEAVSGRELDWFFQQWVELGTVPQLSVTSRYEAGSDSGGGGGSTPLRNASPGASPTAALTHVDGAVVLAGKVVIEVRQDLSSRARYSLPVTVEVATPGGLRRASGWLDGDSTVLEVPSEGPPAWVAFDPDGGVLAAVTQTQEPAAWEAQARDGSPYARRVAVEALADMAQGGVLTAIVLDGNASRGLRRAAADALGKQRATDALVSALRVSDDAVREAVVRALGKGVDDRARQALVGVFEGDPAPDVRAAALRSLAGIAPEAGAKLAQSYLARTARRAPPREAGRIVEAALSVLGEHGAARDLDVVLRTRGPDRTAVRALEAASALAERQDPGAAREVLRARIARAAEPLLEDDDFRVRTAVVAVLGRTGDPRTLDRLEAWARTRHVDDERDAARVAVQAIRARKAAPDRTENARDAALDALEVRVKALEAEGLARP